jgi:hypothetical protein
MINRQDQSDVVGIPRKKLANIRITELAPANHET